MNFIATFAAAISVITLVSASNPHKDNEMPKSTEKRTDMVDFVSGLDVYCNYVENPVDRDYDYFFETGELNQYNEPSLYDLVQEVRQMLGKPAFFTRSVRQQQQDLDSMNPEEKK